MKRDLLTTFYYYTILRCNLIGLEGEGIKQLAEVARIEDRNHFEALTPRIYELGSKLPDDMKVFHDMSACPPARLPKDPTDIKAMLTVLVNAERCALDASIIDALRRKRFKATSQRIAICRIALASREHPTAKRIFAEVKKTYPTVSLTTVYKTLHVLKQLRLVQELAFSKGENRSTRTWNLI